MNLFVRRTYVRTQQNQREIRMGERYGNRALEETASGESVLPEARSLCISYPIIQHMVGRRKISVSAPRIAHFNPQPSQRRAQLRSISIATGQHHVIIHTKHRSRASKSKTTPSNRDCIYSVVPSRYGTSASSRPSSSATFFGNTTRPPRASSPSS